MTRKFPTINRKFIQFILGTFSAVIILVFSSCEAEGNRNSLTNSETNNSPKEELLSNSIANLKLIEIESKYTNQKYIVGIGLPRSYFLTEDKTYPVIYQMDGEGSLHTSIETSRGLALTGYLEEVIIVGVFNYAENSRSLDFTPSKATHPDTKLEMGITENIPTGGSDEFFQFIVSELMPKINSTYKTDKKTNVLFGHSLGGLFCISALQNEKSPFSHYLISSPSIWWNYPEIFKVPLPKRDFKPVVYLSVGELEQIPTNLPADLMELFPKEVIKSDRTTRMVEGIVETYDYLKKQGNVEVYAHIEEGEVHMSSNVPSFSRGIRTLLPGYNRDELRRRSSHRPVLPW